MEAGSKEREWMCWWERIIAIAVYGVWPAFALRWVFWWLIG